MFKILGDIFIPHPYLAIVPAAILGFLYFKNKNSLTLSSSILWLVYAVYEELNLLRITCSGECNIRIDLFLIYPVLIVLSIVGLFAGFRKTNQ